MSEPAQPVTGAVPNPVAEWAASLPPPPFVDATAGPGESRFAALSPRVVVLVAAFAIIGLLLWMARDSVRPFILGLLFVYLLDPPVRWLARRGLRRSLAILLVYVVAIAAFVGFLALTLTPLLNELLRFIADFPKLADQLDVQLQRLGEIYAHLQIPLAIREWIDGLIAGFGQGGSAGTPDLSFLLPLLTGAGSLHRGALRVLHPAVLGVLPAQGQDEHGRPVRSKACRGPGGSTRGPSSRSSSTTSGRGSAARSSSGSRSGSRPSSG